MINNRVIFMFFSLIIIVSTAPILLEKQSVTIKFTDNSTDQTITTTEPVTYEDNSSGSHEQDIELTTVNHEEEEEEDTTVDYTTTTTPTVGYIKASTVKNEEETTVENNEEQETTVSYTTTTTTTTVPVIAANGLLFAGEPDVPLDIDEIIRAADKIFDENQIQVPLIPTTESSEVIQTSTIDEN